MKIYISCDMEGISGVVNWAETGFDGAADYERFRRVMTAEANAAALGAFEGGATEVVINDSHGSMRNIIIEEMDPRIQLVRGSPKPWSMMQGLDGSFDGAFFVGYHSQASSVGVLNHTYTGTVVRYKVNGAAGGETAMNALIAGEYDVPVLLVTGDDQVCAEARALLGPVSTVEVKKAAGRYAAQCLHPAKARELIMAAATQAVREKAAGPASVGVAGASGAAGAVGAVGAAGVAGVAGVKPLKAARPTRVELTFQVSAMADGAALMPGVERVDNLTVGYTAPDYLTGYRAVRAMISLAGR